MAAINVSEKITIDMLSSDSVSILKRTVTEINGQSVQVGEDWRKAFVNSKSGRAEISEALGEPYLSSVMAVWGDTPTVEEEEPATLPADIGENT